MAFRTTRMIVPACSSGLDAVWANRCNIPGRCRMDRFISRCALANCVNRRSDDRDNLPSAILAQILAVVFAWDEGYEPRPDPNPTV